MKNLSQPLRSLLIGVFVFVGLVIFAYGFRVTKVDLKETRSEIRQTQLVRIIRALAKPDLVKYDEKETVIKLPYMVPCPEGGYTPPEQDTTGPYLVVTPACAEPGAEVTIEGFNFAPNTSGPIFFIPTSEVELRLSNLETDAQGHFVATGKLPKRSSEEVQNIQAVTRMRVGAPMLSQTAKDTWDKIVETVFMALLATAIGTLLAVPLSFFASRNLMEDVDSPLISIALSLLFIPIGLVAGAVAAQWIDGINQMLSQGWLMPLIGVIVAPFIILYSVRIAIPQNDTSDVKKSDLPKRIIFSIIAGFALILGGYMLSSLSIALGNTLEKNLGGLGFLGAFIRDCGDILDMIMVVVVALVGAGIMSGFANKLGRRMIKRLPEAPLKIFTVLISTAAGSVLFLLIAAGLDWLYQFENPLWTITIPAVVGGLLGLITAIVIKPQMYLSIGLVIYFIARTIFNALRSIEALIMVIVFVVWVGIGPFAGVLALSLHTIAALAKLYSEQVESILEGPVEAIRATGANRLQTIVYGVIPQIIPPYISFTMYRWDINVRMSTIIGFAGGGGIGFLLIQNINLLNYRAASVQMLAIAVVVASMDYISSKLRETTV